MKSKILRTILAAAAAVTVLCGAMTAFAENAETPQTDAETGKKIVESDATYRVSKHKIDNVAFYDIMRRENEGKSPIVIYWHGLGGCKEDMIETAKVFADAGYFVVVPDIAGHGDSLTGETLDFVQMVVKSAESVDTILSYYNYSNTADNTQYSMGGGSMGGMVAFYAAATNENAPESLVSLISTPNWESLIGSDTAYVKSVDGELQYLTEEERQTLSEEMMEYSPDNHLETLAQIPTLMINGDSDTVIPLYGVNSYLTKLSAYENQTTSILREGRDHTTGTDAEATQDADDEVAFVYNHMPSGQPYAQEYIDSLTLTQ